MEKDKKAEKPEGGIYAPVEYEVIYPNGLKPLENCKDLFLDELGFLYILEEKAIDMISTPKMYLRKVAELKEIITPKK